MAVSKGGRSGRSEKMCSNRLVLDHVTSRWGVLVLIRLLERPHRFSELRRAIGGVSEKMLTQTLQTLERDGVIHRYAHPVIPPRVDYSLTDLGREAAEKVRDLALWVERRIPDVLTAQKAYDEVRTAREEARAAYGKARTP